MFEEQQGDWLEWSKHGGRVLVVEAREVAGDQNTGPLRPL